MSEDTILWRIDGPVATITLNAPERHNALADDDLSSLERIIERLEAERSVRVLILTGSGEKTFCAGAFLGQVKKGLEDGHRYQHVVDRLQAYSPATICSLNGSVYGGGVELALACDFRIGIAGTRLFVPPVRLGICYPYHGLRRFVSRLGLAATKRLLLANETFQADEKNEIGFYDYIVSREELPGFTQALADKLAGFAPLSLQGMKNTINEIALGEGDMYAAQRRERACLMSEDLQEGFAAMEAKRQPVFRGK